MLQSVSVEVYKKKKRFKSPGSVQRIVFRMDGAAWGCFAGCRTRYAREVNMRRILFSLALVLALAVPASAAVDTSKLQLPGDLTLEQAQKVMEGALAFAVKQGVPMNITIVDAGGNLKAFYRMDGAFLGSVDVSMKKARTARMFNMSTAQLGAASQPGQELFGIEVTNGGLVIFGGGELLKDKNGVIVGAIGVSGGSVQEDTNVARAGVEALNK